MRQISLGIRLLGWEGNSRAIVVFASSHTIRGILSLYFKGYRPHKVSFGTVMRKVIYKGMGQDESSNK